MVLSSSSFGLQTNLVWWWCTQRMLVHSLCVYVVFLVHVYLLYLRVFFLCVYAMMIDVRKCGNFLWFDTRFKWKAKKKTIKKSPTNNFSTKMITQKKSYYDLVKNCLSWIIIILLERCQMRWKNIFIFFYFKYKCGLF